MYCSFNTMIYVVILCCITAHHGIDAGRAFPTASVAYTQRLFRGLNRKLVRDMLYIVHCDFGIEILVSPENKTFISSLRSTRKKTCLEVI